MALWLSIRFDGAYLSGSHDALFFKTLAYQYSPHIVWIPNTTEHSDFGICLEISRCLKTFQGFEPLFKQFNAALSAFVEKRHAGLGHSLYCAWLLSYQPDASERTPALQQTEAYLSLLAPLPVHLLAGCRDEQTPKGLSPKDIQHLRNTGFMCLGDIFRHINQQGLRAYKKRWQPQLVEVLEDIIGLPKSPTSFHPETELRYWLDFEHPSMNLDAIGQGMKIALDKLSEDLQKRQLQSDHIAWHFFSNDKQKHSLNITTTEPQKKTALLLELSAIQLEQAGLPFEVDRLCLHCVNRSVIQTHQTLTLFKHQQQETDWVNTLMRLQSRLGKNAIYQVAYAPEHAPENSTTQMLVMQALAEYDPKHIQTYAPRPAWLFKEPVLIRSNTRNELYWKGRLTLIHGPERIENAWWKKPIRREYFIAQRSDHARLWVFQDMETHQWFVQGWFA